MKTNIKPTRNSKIKICEIHNVLAIFNMIPEIRHMSIENQNT